LAAAFFFRVEAFVGDGAGALAWGGAAVLGSGAGAEAEGVEVGLVGSFFECLAEEAACFGAVVGE
jgi:hypothetical protein